MSSAVHLHGLPPELLRLILTSFDSLHDLFSFLQASSQCFRIYRVTPELILSSVIKRAIQADALYHALAVIHLESLQATDPENEEQLWLFLDSYFQRDPTLLEFPTEMSGIISLAKLSNLVSSLAGDYVCHTLKALYANEEAQQDLCKHALASFSCHAAWHIELSVTEQARLQRALFRYELYSRCFPINPRIPGESVYSAEVQFSRFLQQMAPWEVEELSCLHEYFWVRVSSIFSDVEEEIVIKVLDAQTTTAATIKASKQRRAEMYNRLRMYSPTNEDGLDGVCRFECLNLRGLELFGEDERMDLPDILRYLISLGLPFLQSLLVAQGQERRDLLRRHCYGEREFLPHAIYEDPNPAQIPSGPENIPDDDICHVNLGYNLFRPWSVEAVLSAMGIARYWPLRRLGYVFWDIERILDPGINKKLNNARDCDPTRAKKEFHGFIRESAETRLKGIKLPEIVMMEIQDNYSSMLDYGVGFSSDSDTQDSEEDF
ncbi:hypothetical protein V8C35DRAFT_288038 [Trichoderma chlorosporum]